MQITDIDVNDKWFAHNKLTDIFVDEFCNDIAIERNEMGIEIHTQYRHKLELKL